MSKQSENYEVDYWYLF